MLLSEDASVRGVGGQLAAFAAMEWGAADSLRAVLSGKDTASRKGAADMAAHRLPHQADAEVATTTLARLMDDAADEVRKEAVNVAGVLRGCSLRPFKRVIQALIASPAFSDAASQLLYTLEHAPDRVNDLALLSAQRFIDELRGEAADVRTGVAADARKVGQLVIRGLAKNHTTAERAAFLDILNQLLLAGAYGIAIVISESER